MHQDEQMTAREVAARLRCSVTTVNRMALDGRLKPIRKLPGLRGPNLFRREDVEQLAFQRLTRHMRAELAEATST